jgi:hypothetical protein
MRKTRSENERLVHDLIAQAAMEQDQGRETYSDKLTKLMDEALIRMGTPEPQQHRFNLDGLEGLIEETAGGQGDSWRRLPIAVRLPSGQVAVWMTLEVETIGERATTHEAGDSMASYPAVVLTPKTD